MGWARIDDTHQDHPKIVAAGPMAELLDIRAICYSSRFETDGRITRAELTRIGRGMKPVLQANRLVKAGRWRKTKSGFLIVGFLERQPSKAERDSVRARSRERMRSVRANRRDGSRNVRDDDTTHNITTPLPPKFEAEKPATNGQKAARKRGIQSAKRQLKQG